MPVVPALSYPGVYIQEIPSGVRTITGVATSITAFIGRALRGPVDHAITILSFADFERQFGGLDAAYPMGYAVRDFFANGGAQAIIVRAYSPFFAKEQDREDALTAATQAAQAGADKIAKAATDAAAVQGATAADVATKAQDAVAGLTGAGKAAGQAVADAAKQKAAQAAGADKVAKAATDAAAVQGATAADVATKAQDAVAGLTGAGKAAGQAVADAAKQKAAQAGATAADVADAAKQKAAQAGATAADVAAAATAAKADAVKIAAGAAAPTIRARITLPTEGGGSGPVIEAASPGTWGNQLRAAVDYNTLKKDDGSSDPKLYNLFIKDKSMGRIESFLNVASDNTYARYMPRVLANESSLVRAVGDFDKRPDKSPPLNGKDRFDDAVSLGVDSDGTASDSKPLDDKAFKGDPDQKTGLYALEKADLFNLLCIPADTREGNTSSDVYDEALQYCVKRRAMLIVDPPHSWSANPDTAAATAHDKLDSDIGLSGPAARNAALFFPRLKEADPMRGSQLAEFVPCGAVAGVFARTDATRGVWKAPAGIDTTLSGVAGLTATLTDAENGLINPLGINVLRTFPVFGRVVWGSRTLRGADQAADEYKYIPVRRTALYIEESLYRGTKWVVFEPNDEPLWAQIRLNIGAFMQNLFRQGAFEGKTPQDAYFVKCDKETTTQNDINLGIVNIIVGFAPLKPAEFVVIYLQQIAEQIQT
jgi:phage tail sheath protein FI